MPADEPERAPCAECAEMISTEAKTCPHCDYNPGKTAYQAPGLLIGLGALLTIFIVTAIIGLPLILIGVIWAIVIWRRPTPLPTDG